MSRIIEAKAVISGEDRLSKVIDGLNRKLKEVGKSAKVAAEVDRLSKSLKGAQDGLKAIDDYRGKRSVFYTAWAEMQAARKAADEAGRALASAGKPSRALEQNLKRAEAAADAATAAFERQKRAVLDARASLSKGGLGVGNLISEQARLGRAVDQATAALKRQQAVAAAESRLAAGMGASGSAQMARIASGRYVAEGMGASGRALQAERDRLAREGAEARAARRAERREAGTVLGAGVAVAGAHHGKTIAKDAITSAAEFDLAVRKQRMFTDISDAEQAGLLAQAKRIGQETQFSNLDVVKAQTAAMQGLPAGFAPGLKAAVAEGIVANVRNFSTLLETDLKQGTEIIRGYLQQTGKDISTKEKALGEANKATNQLVKMAKAGGMSGEDVEQFLKFAAASGTSAGLSSETLMSLAALARRGGLRGDEAGTFIRSAASKIVAPTSQGIAALNAAGINFNDYVKMPGTLSTDALATQFTTTTGKTLTPEIRRKLDAINTNKELIGDRARYVGAVVEAVGDVLGKTKDGKVRASDTQTAAKAARQFHKISAESVDSERLLDDAMSKGMTLPQLNAWLTDKHGGKGAISQRQWDEFKAAREQIAKAGDDPDWAKKRADEVFAGLGGAVENLKGSFENLVLTIGNANAGLVKWGADKLGAGLDTFSRLPEGAQQGLSLGAGTLLAGGGIWGSAKLLRTLVGLGAPGGGKVASSAAAKAASAKIVEGMGGAAAAATGIGAGALVTGGTLAGGALLGAGLDAATPGTNAGISGLLTGAESSLQQTARFLRAERAAAAAMGGASAPSGAAKVLPGASGGTGYATTYERSRGVVGDFLFGKDKAAATLPGFGLGGKTLPVEVVSLPASADRSGQAAALHNTLDAAASASATAANGGKPIEATVKPDQIVAKIDQLPPVTGEATVTLEPQRVIVELNSDMLNAKIDGAVSSKVAKLPLSSSGARPSAVSMPGATGAPGSR